MSRHAEAAIADERIAFLEPGSSQSALGGGDVGCGSREYSHTGESKKSLVITGLTNRLVVQSILWSPRFLVRKVIRWLNS